jgi:hypothetical protein
MPLPSFEGSFNNGNSPSVHERSSSGLVGNSEVILSLKLSAVKIVGRSVLAGPTL